MAVTMNDMDVFVAIEQGPQAARALAYDASGRRLGEAFSSLGPRRNALGHLEYDPFDLLDAIQVVVDSLAREVSADRWVACGLVTEASAVACWDEASDEPLSPIIAAGDRRAGVGPSSQLRTALQRVSGQPFAGDPGGGRLRWWLDHSPAVRTAAAAGTLVLGPLSSFLLHQLLDNRPRVTDQASAASLDLCLPGTPGWCEGLLELFGLPRDFLPSIARTATLYGHLRVGERRVPLTASTVAGSAEPLAGGLPDPRTIYARLDDTTTILQPTATPVIAPPLATRPLVDIDGLPGFALGGSMGGVGHAIDALAAQHGADADRLLLSLEGAPLPGVDAPLHLADFGSGLWRAELQPRLEGPGDLREQLAAILEATAFMLRAHLDEMRRHGLPAPTCLVAEGRLAANRWICRLVATLVGVPVLRSGSNDAAARGLAWIVAGHPGGWTRPHVETILPGPHEAALARYLRWLSLMPPPPGN